MNILEKCLRLAFDDNAYSEVTLVDLHGQIRTYHECGKLSDDFTREILSDIEFELTKI